MADSDYNFMVNNPLQEIVRIGAIAYNGHVIDNVEVNIKGHASRSAPKVSWKFHTPQGYDLDMPGLLVEPVDEFDMQADWSDRSHGRAIVSWEAYERSGFPTHQMFPIRTQRNGAFQGEYSLQDTYDGTWREREGYDDKQFFEAETSAFSTSPANVQFSKKSPDTTDFAPIAAFISGVRADRHRPAQLPPGQRRPSADDQLRGGHRDHRAPRLLVEELLHVPGPGHRALEHPAVGPRPHAGQRLLPASTATSSPRPSPVTTPAP